MLRLEPDDAIRPNRVYVVTDGEDHSEDLKITCPAAISKKAGQPWTDHTVVVYGPTQTIVDGGSGLIAAMSTCVLTQEL
jgi:hypothetical protein